MIDMVIGIILTAACLAECLEAFLRRGDTNTGIYMIVLTVVAFTLTVYSVVKFRRKLTKIREEK